MATLILNATASFTGAATWAATETGTSALALIRANTNTMLSAGTNTSPTFTVTNTNVIDGVLLWLRLDGTNPGTGTFKVDLQKGGVSQASVTVNKSDLPDSNNSTTVPVFFKFTGTATGDGGSNWTLVFTTTNGTGSTEVRFSRNSGTSNDFSRAFRRTTAATAAAGDNLYVVGELTGAATRNSFTVTMDSLTATAYGAGAANFASTSTASSGIFIGAYGTLTYGNSAGTNYVLRVNGDIVAFQFGVFICGNTSGSAEIPRDSTAVLEFQQNSSDCEFGFQGLENSTVVLAGLSRTSGKNVVKTKLTSNVVSPHIGGTSFNQTNCSNSGNALGPDNLSLLPSAVVENTTNGVHTFYLQGGSLSNTTQVGTIWLARGTGTNNRYVRVQMGNSGTVGSITNGFYADVDLQTGTIGTCTAVGNGTATSATIVAVNNGFVIEITGKVSSGSATTFFHCIICSAPGTTSFAGSNTHAVTYEHFLIATASSIADTVFNISDDTGWKSGDVFCVSSTTRTHTDSDLFPLNADAGSSSLVSSVQVGRDGNAITYLGTTAPMRADIGLLTRNVKVRSTSSTLMTYVYITALCNFNAQWVEFYYMGDTPTKKRGVEIDAGATATAKSITYCSFHDCEDFGFYCANPNTSLNVTFSNNVLWLCAEAVTISGSITNTDWTFDNNLVIRTINNTTAYTMGDVGGTFTNNIAAGSNNWGVRINESGVAFGTWSGNSIHSCNGGLLVNSYGHLSSGQDGWTIWHNNNFGINNTGAYDTSNITWSNLTLLGNLTTNFNQDTSSGITMTGTNVFAGTTLFSTTNGFNFINGGVFALSISGLDTSASTTGLAVMTNDFNGGSATGTHLHFNILNNCKFGSTNLIPTAFRTLWSKLSNFAFQKYNQIAGDHRTEMKYGQVKTDTTIFNDASPSMRMTPNNASNKLESARKNCGIQVAVSNGNTVTPSVYVRKDAVYNGNQPRLIVRANSAIGITSDTVLATYSASTGSWNVISGTTVAATDDGVMEFIVDCDGTAGYINVDDWSFV